MEVLEGLTPELRSVVRQFCSHPAADALRKSVANWNDHLNTLTDDTHLGANTFYMFYFTVRRLESIMSIVEQIPEMSGVHFSVSEMALRPKLWRLYEQAFPNYFEDNRFNSDHIDYDAHDFVDSEMEEDDLETN